MIPVTKPFLPPTAEYNKYLEGIWQRNWLTNNGPLVNELETRLKSFLQVPNMLYLGNGTIALQMAIKALGLEGEIITTPFSYVATTSSIVWENCKPVFADIDENSLNIDPLKIEPLITSKTSAILATHCFGNACEISKIEEIAIEHELKVIYDAAHCFGTLYNGKSIYNYGHISTTSFHATKLFHTIEGGAVFASKLEHHKALTLLRNFGHTGPNEFSGIGINGKNSEFHAAMGLTNLQHIDAIMASRKKQAAQYNELLTHSGVRRPTITEGCEFNYAYYPVIFPSESILLSILKLLNTWEIFPRRYFYPSLSSLDYVDHFATPVSDDIANRILCLPVYHDLSYEEQLMVTQLIKQVLDTELNSNKDM